jgi:diguanylate cyclase with GGDEF domain
LVTRRRSARIARRRTDQRPRDEGLEAAPGCHPSSPEPKVLAWQQRGPWRCTPAIVTVVLCGGICYALGRIVAVAEPITVDGRDRHIRASIGIAVPQPRTGVTDLLHRADQAMHAAERRGTHNAQLHGDDLALQPAHNRQLPAT